MFLRPVTPRVRPKPSEGEGAGIPTQRGRYGPKKKFLKGLAQFGDFNSSHLGLCNPINPVAFLGEGP